MVSTEHSVEPTLTSDPNRVIEVWWGWPTNILYDFDPNEYAVDLPYNIDQARTHTFRQKLSEGTKELYPNLQTLYMENTGWDGDWAQFGPRAITDDDSIYEPFFDDMTVLEDTAAAYAIARHPFDYEQALADQTSEQEEEDLLNAQQQGNKHVES